jgi:hypothetical protein
LGTQAVPFHIQYPSGLIIGAATGAAGAGA